MLIAVLHFLEGDSKSQLMQSQEDSPRVSEYVSKHLIGMSGCCLYYADYFKIILNTHRMRKSATKCSNPHPLPGPEKDIVARMKTFAVAFIALCLAVAVAGAYHPSVDELVALPTGTAEGAQLCFIGQRPTAME